jgi:hypothetical protein
MSYFSIYDSISLFGAVLLRRLNGTFGPIGRSSRFKRFRHFASVFGLMLYRSLSAWSEAFDRLLPLGRRE